MTGHLELQSYLAAVEMERFVKVNVGISHSTSSLINLSETPPSKSDY